MTVGGALQSAAKRLGAEANAGRLEAEVLLAHVLGQSRASLYARDDGELAPLPLAAFERLIERRAAGEPIAYLTGRREFWSLELRVTPATLIPRPESEMLVDLALHRPCGDRAVALADLGTGGGAVALSIASERPHWRVVGTECSSAALDVARANASALRITNVEWRLGDWCEALGDEQFDLVVCNPPYVADGDPHLQCGDVRFEPAAALSAGLDGLDAIRLIARDARARLAPGGGLSIEHGHAQGAAVRSLLAGLGYREIRQHRDYAGHERVVAASFVGT